MDLVIHSLAHPPPYIGCEAPHTAVGYTATVMLELSFIWLYSAGEGYLEVH